MSHRRRAQFGLISACFILVVTIGVLFAGAKASVERQGTASAQSGIQPHVGEVNLVSLRK